MHYFFDDYKVHAKKNENYRQVLYTTQFTQVVLMCLPENGGIPQEVHTGDQLFILVEGEGLAVLNGERVTLAKNHLLVVPAGTQHEIKNSGESDLKLVTIYSPPHHSPGTIQKTMGE